MASTVAGRELERALAEALSKKLTTRAELNALLKRHVRHPGVSRLRPLVESADPVLTRSEAEERFLALLRKAQLPAPEVNVTVGGYEVDFVWRKARFVAEVDGYAFHSSAHRFESDRRRDAALAADGLRVMRVTWRQLVKEPEAVVVRLAQALARTTE